LSHFDLTTTKIQAMQSRNKKQAQSSVGVSSSSISNEDAASNSSYGDVAAEAVELE